MTEPNQFLTNEKVQSMLGLEEIDDAITNLIFKANRRITQELTPYLDIINTTGSEYFEIAQDVAYEYFNSIYQAHQSQHQNSDMILKQYQESLKVLIRAIENRPTTDAKRSVIAHATSSYNSPLLENVHKITDRRGLFIDRYR